MVEWLQGQRFTNYSDGHASGQRRPTLSEKHRAALKAKREKHREAVISAAALERLVKGAAELAQTLPPPVVYKRLNVGPKIINIFKNEFSRVYGKTLKQVHVEAVDARLRAAKGSTWAGSMNINEFIRSNEGFSTRAIIKNRFAAMNGRKWRVK